MHSTKQMPPLAASNGKVKYPGTAANAFNDFL